MRALTALLMCCPTTTGQTIIDRLDLLERGVQQVRPTQYVPDLTGMVRYKPQRNHELPHTLQQSGGLEGVTGWYSELFRSYHARGATGWEVGATFADVLRNASGVVFEHREATKREDGSWDRFIVYRNRDARPAGYKGISARKCVECHGKLPAHQDTIFSIIRRE